MLTHVAITVPRALPRLTRKLYAFRVAFSILKLGIKVARAILFMNIALGPINCIATYVANRRAPSARVRLSRGLGRVSLVRLSSDSRLARMGALNLEP